MYTRLVAAVLAVASTASAGAIPEPIGIDTLVARQSCKDTHPTCNGKPLQFNPGSSCGAKYTSHYSCSWDCKSVLQCSGGKWNLIEGCNAAFCYNITVAPGSPPAFGAANEGYFCGLPCN